MAETKKYVRIKKATVDGVWYADKIGQIFEVAHENSIALLTKCIGCHSVLREDAEVIVTEKRKAAVGERILITRALAPSGVYKNGDILKVREVEHRAVTVEEVSHFIVDSEYEVIVNSEVKNEEADEMKNGKTRYDLAVENAREAIEELRLAAYEQGYEDARLQINAKDPAVSTQARRDEIVEQAKADLENLADEDGPVYQTEDNEGYPCSCYASFRVNKEHRTVACDLRGVRTGERYKRGIAKAAPSDCFNVHIGKAIALRRALGLAVPDEYLNAPQPTDVRVGDVIVYRGALGTLKTATVVPNSESVWKSNNKAALNSYAVDHVIRITDDSREEVGGE